MYAFGKTWENGKERKVRVYPEVKSLTYAKATSTITYTLG
jgi:hypothetical protein